MSPMMPGAVVSSGWVSCSDVAFASSLLSCFCSFPGSKGLYRKG